MIEAMLTMVIMGIGVASMLQLLATGTACNVEATQSTMAVNLARNVRELTLKLPFAEVCDLDGMLFVTPVDSRGQALAGFEGWSQRILVQPVSFERLTTSTVEVNPEAVRLTVEVAYNGKTVGEARWYRFRPGSS